MIVIDWTDVRLRDEMWVPLTQRRLGKSNHEKHGAAKPQSFPIRS